MKTAEGQLYFMEKYLVFLTRQPLVIPYADIAKVRFERVSGTMASTRTFDMRLEMRDNADQVFSAVQRDEQSPISDFLTAKNVKVKKEVVDDMVDSGAALAAALAVEDSDQSDASEDDAPKRDKGKGAAGDDDEDSEGAFVLTGSTDPCSRRGLQGRRQRVQCRRGVRRGACASVRRWASLDRAGALSR